MHIIAETHSHSIALDAYSTITENAYAAKQKNLKFLCVTEHATGIPGAPTAPYFDNLVALPRIIHDVVIIRGCEANVMDFDGRLDLSDATLSRLEWVIASMHVIPLSPGNTHDHTRAWMSIARNPLVDVIGHCGDERFAFDHEPVVKECAKNGKIIEINSHSFDGGRIGSKENCTNVARLCAKYGTSVVVSSDSHYIDRVGDFQPSIDLLKAIDFPEHLILNADYDRFADWLKKKGVAF